MAYGRQSFRNAKHVIGRSWTKTKQFVHGAKEALDVGAGIYGKLRPVADAAVQAYGNERARDFANKAHAGIAAGIRGGHDFHREIAGNVDQIDNLAQQFMGAFR